RRVAVVDSRGRPVAGAVITLEDGLLPLTETDAKGQATLIVDRGDVSLDVLGPGGRRGSQVLSPIEKLETAGSPETEIITLEEPITVSGRVIDEKTRQPIANALVWTRSATTGRSDGGGGYLLTGPREDLRTISAAAAGYSQGVGMVGGYRGSALPAGETAAEGPAISLAPAASLQGVVVDRDGDPLRSVEVGIESKRGRRSRGVSFRPPSIGSRSGRTSEQGRFQITGLALDSGYLLHFVKDGFAPAKLEIDDLASHEGPGSLRIVMQPGRRGVGRVVDEQDAPVAGAEVRLTEATATSRRRFFDPSAGRKDRPDSVTGADGRFEIADVAPGRYDLEAEAASFAVAAVPGIEILDGTGELDLGTIVLIPGATIEGRVVDPRGRPIEGAGIRVIQPSRMPASFLRHLRAGQPPDAVSEADGRFLVTDQQPGGRVDLSVEKEGFVAASVSGVEVPSQEPLEIVLRAASKVLGRVVDMDGQPVAGAAVEVDPERQGGSGMGHGMSGRRRETSAEDGTFEVFDVEPGRVTVAVSAAGFRRQEIAGLEVPADEPLRDLELVLVPGAEVRGTVTEADGSPAAGIFVGVTDPGSTGLGHDSTLTDADGKFLIPGTAAGLRKVLAMDRASRRTSKNLEIELGTNVVDLVFAGGGEVTGHVIDDTGAAVAGALVTLRQSRIPGVPRFGRLEASSGADGGFTVSDVQPGTYELAATKKGYAAAELDEPVEIDANPVAGLILRLTAGATLSGRVLGLEYDDLVRVEIRARVSGSATAKPDFEGRYRIPNLPAGELTVQAEIPGSGRQVRAKTTIPEGAQGAVLDLEFGSGFTLTGIVLHGDHPVGGAALRLSGASVSHSGGATVSQDGTFRVEGLVEGSYRLSVSDWESGLQHGEEIEITADADVRIEISTARIAGRVRDAIDFAPIEAASVTAKMVDAAGGPMPGRNVARSDARGYFSLGEVAEGRWKVSAVKSGYGPAERTVEVRAGSAIEDLDLAMSATEGLSFEVVMASGRTPSAVQAAFLDGAGHRVAGGTFEVSSGEVTITTVPAGSWEMLLIAEDSALMSLPVAVPGELGRVVAPPGGRLLITVPELEQGTASATIRLTGPDGRPHRFLDYRANVSPELTLRGGRARAANLTPGVWTVHAVASDGRSWSTSATVVPGAETAVSVP
ncbi:MAG: carboxypeptidase regulatory-like domain-containing protein, partial [Thermoanaerobaculia bacterium]